MKKFLPKSLNNPSGFTLIELMVVISIIAILSVVGIGVFGGAQGGARDARRKTELQALAQNIESTRNAATGFYKYTTAESQGDYPNITTSPYVPTDPGSYVYCVIGSSTTTPVAAPGNLRTGACPNASWSTLGNSVTGTATTLELTDGTAKAFTLCAYMERENAPYCVTNLIR